MTVKALNGNITTKTARNGSYTLTLPIELADSTIRIEFSAEGYAARTENLLIQDPLRPIALERLQSKSEGPEIFTSKNGLKGLQTPSGKTILPARYNNIELDPSSGLYRVQILSKLGLQMGYVNEQGKEIIPVEYRVLGFQRDGRILAAKERYGYLDRNGNISISFIYEGASDFSKGEAEVIQLLEGQRFTFIINKEGRCIRSCPPESAYIQQKSVEQVKMSENIEPIELYFDMDAPDANNQATTTDDNYSRLFADLFSKKEQYVSSDATQQAPVLDRRRIDDFFSNEVQDNYNRFNETLETTLNYLRNTKGQVEITLRGHASSDGSSAYSRILSARRISSVKNSLLNYNKGELRPYLESGRLKITEEALGDSQINSKTKGDLNIGKNLRSLNALLQQKVEVIIRFAN
ncbi:MAG: WG repeat-containing protein [Saprospiraceae bacterium]|nr:WG repeat-containing protein [Saprospiraceae bacterium]